MSVLVSPAAIRGPGTFGSGPRFFMEHAQSQQSSALPAVRAIELLALAAGWPDRAAFECALMLVAAGVTAAEAERLFWDAARRVQ